MARPIALVTGGATGIGRAIVEVLAQDFDVAFTFHAGRAEAAALENALGCCKGRYADLGDPGAATTIVDWAVSEFGGLNALVNNAAVIASDDWFDLSADNFEWHQRVNVTAPAQLIAAAMPYLKEVQGAVVNISSLNGRIPSREEPAYSASKAALESLTKTAAKKFGPDGVRINAVAPGFIADPATPYSDDLRDWVARSTALGRAGGAEDIAQVVRFLCSDAASYMTGTVLAVDGGFGI